MNGTLRTIRALIETGVFENALDILDGLAREAPRGKAEEHECVLLRAQALCGLGRWQLAIEHCSPALKTMAEASDIRSLSLLHGWLGTAHLRTGSLRKAEAHFRAAIHILTWDLDDPAGALKEQKRLGLMFHNLGRWSQARHEYEAAIASADEHGIHREAAGIRINLAITLIKSGRFQDVQGLLADAERTCSDFLPDNIWLRTLTHLVRANYLRIAGNIPAALNLLQTALETCRLQGYSRQEAIALEYMGDCHLAKKDFQRALDLYQAGMKIAEATAPKGDLVPELCHRIGECLSNLGNPNDAILVCERGLRVAKDIGDRYEECATHRVLAMSHKAAGNPTKALRIADEGIELGRSYEIPYELARTLVWAGDTRLAAPGIDEQALGRKQLWEARNHFTRMGLKLWVEAVDGSLGYEPASSASIEEASISALADLEELDRGALRFGIVTCDRHVREAVATVQSIAPSSIPVLICGESGVGKELLAQAVHQMSDRRRGPFVAVNCGAIASSLLESEMFGHERGAFTGAVTSREGLIASAHKGTLFLDEVGDLPLPAQASLLRVLESGEIRPLGKDDLRKVDIRIVAATNAQLEDLVPRGMFRQDLFFRLNGVRVTIPPLREREGDVRALFRYFWAQACAEAKKSLRVAPDVEAMLSAYAWPGNARELKHEVARVVALAPENSIVTPEHFLPGQRSKDAYALRRARARSEASGAEREEILTALRAHRGNKAEAARSLGGMKRTTLIYKMERLGIRAEEYEARE